MGALVPLLDEKRPNATTCARVDQHLILVMVIPPLMTGILISWLNP